MKIKIAKIVFLGVCVGLFVFLLLPFLETTPPPALSALKTQPQVVTDNPLTAVAKRLRHLFGGKERTARRLTQAQSFADVPQPTDEFLTSATPAKHAPNPPDMPPTATGPTHAIDVPQPEELFDFGDATLQTDQGEWVLIRQTAPQNGQPGMHEVNVHDNPYDRYVKQERIRRALPQQPKQEIPDSKWARLVRPVKRFLGLDTPTPVGPSSVSVSHSNSHAASLALVQANKQADPKYSSMGPLRLPWPDITPEAWAKMTPQQRTQERERRSIAQFTDLFSGEHAAKNAAEMMADTKYPNPQTKEEEQAKEEYIQQLTEQNKQVIRETIFQLMQERAAGKEPVDELSYMMGCKSTSLPDTSDACDPSPDGQATPPPATPQDVIEREQIKNAEDFFQKTKYVFPKGLPLTPVLGPTTPQTIANMSGPDENTQKTAEIYQFLYEYNQCASETCYWVANSKQIDPRLGEAITMANATLKPDPQNTYPTYKEPFVQYKLEQLGEEATEEQKKKAREDAEKQFEQNAVHFVPYGTKLLHDTQQQKITTLYLDDLARSPEFATAIDSVNFVSSIAPLKEADSNIETSRLINQSFIQEVEDRKEAISNQVIKPAVSTTLSQSLNPNKKTKKTGKGIAQAFKNWQMNK